MTCCKIFRVYSFSDTAFTTFRVKDTAVKQSTWFKRAELFVMIPFPAKFGRKKRQLFLLTSFSSATNS